MRNPYRRAQSFRSLPKYRAVDTPGLGKPSASTASPEAANSNVDSWRLYTAGLTRLNTNPTTTGRQISCASVSRASASIFENAK